MKIGINKKTEGITAVWRDWGFRLNLKMVLYLENLCLTEKSRIFNPKPRVAPERYGQACHRNYQHQPIE